jgi:hypothetical protein
MMTPKGARLVFFPLLVACLLQLAIKCAGAAPADWTSQSVTGTWNGTYVCGQGETGLTVTIAGGPSGQINAVIKFFPISTTKIQISPGSYSATGVIESNGRFTLKPVAWINQPGNLAMLSYVGKLNEDSTVFEGIVPQCGFGKKFRTTKSSSNEAASHTAGSGSTTASGTAPDSNGKDEFSDPGQSAKAAANDDKVDPRSFTVAGVRLGMTKSEAAEAMKKFNPSMAVYEEWYAKDGVADSPFPGGFNPIVNLTPAEAKQKGNTTLVSVWASSRAIADDFLKAAHTPPRTEPKSVPKTTKRISTIGLGPPGVPVVSVVGKDGKTIYIDQKELPKDSTGLHGNKWAGCLGAEFVGSQHDSLELTMVFSPSETDPRVISVDFNEHFCDSTHEPTIDSIRESLFKKFSRQITMDPLDLPNPPLEVQADLNYQLDKNHMMWRFDARNRVMDGVQAARIGLLRPGVTFKGGSVGLDARVWGDTGARSTGATGLEISVWDQDKYFTWEDDLKKLGAVQKARETERAKKGLSNDPNRTPF